jgi:hypothetical protein
VKSILGSMPLITILFLIGCASDVELTGDVFIVTQSGQSIKLGLVEVQIIPESAMQPFVQSKLQTAKSELERIDIMEVNCDKELEQISREVKQATNNEELTDLESRLHNNTEAMRIIWDERKKYTGGSFFMSGLPTPELTTKTDADGKFMLRLKPGKYAIAAYAQRTIIDSTEKHYWLVWTAVRSSQPKRLMLSNDNLFEAHCDDCVFVGKNFEHH